MCVSLPRPMASDVVDSSESWSSSTATRATSPDAAVALGRASPPRTTLYAPPSAAGTTSPWPSTVAFSPSAATSATVSGKSAVAPSSPPSSAAPSARDSSGTRVVTTARRTPAEAAARRYDSTSPKGAERHTHAVQPSSCAARSVPPSSPPAGTKSSLSRSPEYRAWREMSRFLAEATSGVTATMGSHTACRLSSSSMKSSVLEASSSSPVTTTRPPSGAGSATS
mmetsp:Transcript_7671/g.25998  ORF Transcript_7671/g.25998 Transcript_7671/m.25998 type:complete len:225 (+) Transcript_7671:1103-1777(+)